jgi:hypothetical protein
MCRGTDWQEESAHRPSLLDDELLSVTRARPGVAA